MKRVLIMLTIIAAVALACGAWLAVELHGCGRSLLP